MNHQQEIVIETLASEEFKGGEEGMATVQCWDGQDIDKAQRDGQEGCEQPEALPVPRIGENVANADEATYLTCSLLREDVLHLVGITGQRFPSILYTSRERFEKSVGFGRDLILIRHCIGETQREFGRERHLLCDGIIQHQCDLTRFQTIAEVGFLW